MKKRRFAGSLNKYQIGDESFEVEMRLSPYRRTTSLTLRKNGFVCNAPKALPREKIDSFIVTSIPKIMKKVKAKPLPIEGDDLYIYGKKSEWKELTAKEQVKMLNAWAGMYELFYRFLKDED